MSAPRNPAADHDASLASECLGLFGIDLEVKVQFRRSGYLALQRVTCEFHDGTAWLHGHLPTFYLKQMAQEIVCAVVGVRSVVNQIEVGPRRAPDTAARPEPDAKRLVRCDRMSALKGNYSPIPASTKESEAMLVLSRKMNESVIIDGGIRVMVVGVRGNQVRLGFEAPSGVRIFREELCVTSKPTGEGKTPPASADASGTCCALPRILESDLRTLTQVMTGIKALDTGSSATRRRDCRGTSRSQEDALGLGTSRSGDRMTLPARSSANRMQQQDFADQERKRASRSDSTQPIREHHREEQVMPLFKQILFAADFSETSRDAFRIACSLARESDSRILVLHVLEAFRVAEEPVYLGQQSVRYIGTDPTESSRESVESRLSQTYVPDRPILIEYRAQSGLAAEEILRVSREAETDLIVMGTHGRSGISRFLAGSVAESVLRAAQCPVLALRSAGHVEAPAGDIQVILAPIDLSAAITRYRSGRAHAGTRPGRKARAASRRTVGSGRSRRGSAGGGPAGVPRFSERAAG